MDRQRIEVISSLLLLIIIVVSVVGMGRYYFVTRQLDRIEREDAQRVIGSDENLLETVENLESTLRERSTYQWVSEKDPLDLTKVIADREFLQKLGADQKDPDNREMRLAATVVSDDGGAAAVIRYLGSGYILYKGDEIEGWTVSEINKETVTLVRNGQRKILENRPVRETLQATGTILSVRPIKNEDWESMYMNAGFPGDNAPVEVIEPEEAGEDTVGTSGTADTASQDNILKPVETDTSTVQSDTSGRGENW